MVCDVEVQPQMRLLPEIKTTPVYPMHVLLENCTADLNPEVTCLLGVKGALPLLFPALREAGRGEGEMLGVTHQRMGPQGPGSKAEMSIVSHITNFII